MPIHAIARLIQTMLYARRFFPYYVYNILGGIEEDGEFYTRQIRRCYNNRLSYDPISHLSRGVAHIHSFILIQELVLSTLLIL